MVIASPRATARDFRIAPAAFYGDLDMLLALAIPGASEREALSKILWPIVEWQRQSSEVLNRAMQGKLNALGTVTLTANQATTTLLDRRVGPDSVILPMPTTANAAAELATLYQTTPNVTAGAMILNHANNAQVDRVFIYALLG